MPNSKKNDNPEKDHAKGQDRSEAGTPSKRHKNESDRKPAQGTNSPIKDSLAEKIVDPSFIGKYQIQRSIGRGGMGVVYLGLNPDTEGLVAIKTLPDNLAQTNLIARFKREAKLAAKVNHPNAVRVLDAGYDHKTGKHYIVTEYVDGQDLEKIMSVRGGRLPWSEAIGIIKSVTKGLKEAARHGIVHRDIKPANVIVASNAVVKLTDLGIAKQMDVDSKLTIDHQIVGTPAYLSPEQILSPKDVDTRSDIYSLGATFFHLLSGNYPFAGASHYDMMRKIVSEPTPDICETIPDIPKELGEIICKMMQKSADDRYQNPDELLEALHGVQPEGGTPSVMTTLIKGKLGIPLKQGIPDQASNANSKQASGLNIKSDKRIRVILLSIILAFCIVGAVFYYLTNDPVGQNEEHFVKSDSVDVNASNIDRIESSTALGKESIPNKKQSKPFQVSENDLNASLKKVEPTIADPDKTSPPSQNKEALSQEKTEITPQDQLLQDVFRVKSMMLDSKSSAAVVDAERLSESTYQLGVSAEQRGEAAFKEGDYEGAKQAYSQANDSFNLSMNKAKRRAEQEAINQKAAEELRKIREDVVKAKQKMLEAKLNAKQIGAETAAEKIYRSALAKQRKADENFDKGTSNSLPLALNSYMQAVSLYEQAVDHIKKILQLKEKADSRITEMLEIKGRIRGNDDVKGANDKFKRAEFMEFAGGGEYKSENYSAAESSFFLAKNLYMEAAEEIILTLRQNAENAKSSMLKAKDVIDTGYHSESSYKEALTVENQGNGAFRQKDYEKAINDYKIAQDLYDAIYQLSAKKMEEKNAEIDAKINQENAVRNQIDELVKTYKQHLQERDVNGLSALLNFSKREERSWQEFFRIAMDLKCRVESQNLEVRGNKASLDLKIMLSYLNRHNNKWADRNLPMIWKLEKIDGVWKIIAR